MNIKDVREWYVRGGEVFIEHSEEIAFLIEENLRLTDLCFDQGIELAELKGLPTPYEGT